MKIESLGYYLPPATPLSELIKKFPRKWQYPVNERSGITYLLRAKKGEYSLELAREAVKRCLSISQYRAADIDTIICCNISKLNSEDSLDIEPVTSLSIARYLGCGQIACFDINNACAGLFTGLYVARSMLASKTAGKVLVVSGEYITKLGDTVLKESQGKTDYQMQDLLATLTLSDSAVAMVVESGKGFTDIQLRTYGEHSDLCRGYPTPNGPIMVTRSAELARRAAEYSTRHTIRTLYKNAWENESPRFVIPHQTAEKIIHKAVYLVNEKDPSIHCNFDNTLVNLRARGNTSTTTHFVALMDKILEGEINPGDKIVFSISASGITIGTALYEMDDLSHRVRMGKIPTKLSPRPYALKTPIAYVEDVATWQPGPSGPQRTFPMVRTVLEKLLEHRPDSEEKIDLLLFSGMYVSDFISEPAIAAMLLKEAELSPGELKNWFSENVLAFDLKLGSLGTQKALEVAHQLLQYQGKKKALIVSSEVSEPGSHATRAFPVLDQASALLLTCQPERARFCLTASHQYNYLQYLAAFQTRVTWKNQKVEGLIDRSEQLDQHFTECIKRALRTFFEETKTNAKHYHTIALPNLNQDYLNEISPVLPREYRAKLCILPRESNAFTASIPLTLEQWGQTVQSSDTLLYVQIAAGIQVSISVWEKK